MILILLCSVFATIFLAVAWNYVKFEPDKEPQKRNTTTTVREEPHRQGASSHRATYLDDFEYDCDDPELEDFDPDIDEAPEGYFINDFGDLEPITSDMEAEANWQECKRQIDYSLYVTHDWDIFKDEKDK